MIGTDDFKRFYSSNSLKGCDYFDFRVSQSDSNHVSVKSGAVDECSTGSLSSFSVRVMLDKSWGFSSTNDFNKINESIGSAVRLAKLAGVRSLESELSEEDVFEDKKSVKPKIKLEDVNLDDKVRDTVEFNKSLDLKGIHSFDSEYIDSSAKLLFMSSEGARIEQSFNACLIQSLSRAMSGGALEVVMSRYGGLFGYELMKKSFPKASECSKDVLKLVKASKIKPDVYDVVMDSSMTGTICHEAVGHACEADAVLTGESCLSGKIGTRLGSDLVNIFDDATMNRAFGTYFYDDEGVAARKTELIKNGVLKGFLHSRETAAKMKTHSTGNARGQSVAFFPIVRMSNTGFERGDSSFDELIDVKKGLFLKGFRGGQVDPTGGTYQFACEGGYVIEDGTLTLPVKSAVVVGDIFSTLKSVDAVGKDVEFNHPGNCGKGMQIIRVSDSGPCIRVRKMRVRGM